MGTTCFKSNSKRKEVNEPLPHEPENPFSMNEAEEHRDEEEEKDLDIVYAPRRITNPDPDAEPESFPNPDLDASPIVLEDVFLDSKPSSSIHKEESVLEEVMDLQSKEEESKSERLSIRSRRSSLKPQKRRKWNIFQKDETVARAVKAATRPSKLPNFDEYNKPPGKDDKDFPVKDLERISELRRDRLPLDILTRRTKILNLLQVKMGMLEVLQLIDCKLSTFPPLFKSKIIRKLDFSNNLISTIPESIEKLQSLEDLNMSQNRLISLPAGFGACSKLTTLNLNRNQLKDLSSILLSNFPSLTYLALNHNKFEHLYFSISDIPRVKELDLSMNELTSVSDDFFTDETCELVVLKLSLNPLKTVGTRASLLTHLERMDLRQTHIGPEHAIIKAIKDRNEENPDEESVVCLINQLVSYRTEVADSVSQTLKTPPAANLNESIPADAPATTISEVVVLAPSVPGASQKSRGSAASLVEYDFEDEGIYAQTDVHIEEILYQLPPTTSVLYALLKDMTNQIGDSASIVLTVATIEKIVKKGLEVANRGNVIADVPLTSQYFVERIAKYPSALNILSAFKYQVKDDARRGLVLRAGPSQQSQRKPSKKPAETTTASPPSEALSHMGQYEETVEQMLIHLGVFKESVIQEAAKQMNTPDFKAYNR